MCVQQYNYPFWWCQWNILCIYHFRRKAFQWKRLKLCATSTDCQTLCILIYFFQRCTNYTEATPYPILFLDLFPSNPSNLVLSGDIACCVTSLPLNEFATIDADDGVCGLMSAPSVGVVKLSLVFANDLFLKGIYDRLDEIAGDACGCCSVSPM